MSRIGLHLRGGFVIKLATGLKRWIFMRFRQLFGTIFRLSAPISRSFLAQFSPKFHHIVAQTILYRYCPLNFQLRPGSCSNFELYKTLQNHTPIK